MMHVIKTALHFGKPHIVLTAINKCLCYKPLIYLFDLEIGKSLNGYRNNDLILL